MNPPFKKKISEKEKEEQRHGTPGESNFNI
jgi:hypothetical protein